MQNHVSTRHASYKLKYASRHMCRGQGGTVSVRAVLPSPLSETPDHGVDFYRGPSERCLSHQVSLDTNVLSLLDCEGRITYTILQLIAAYRRRGMGIFTPPLPIIQRSDPSLTRNILPGVSY